MLVDSDRAAQVIADHIRPAYVLVLACGDGSLVQKLRNRGVLAWGQTERPEAATSISPAYVIAQSLAEPFSRFYDLVVWDDAPVPDTLEAAPTIDKICAMTNDILFSAPDGVWENWAKAFARRGFFRDLGLDASFVTSHALRFRRLSDVGEAVAAYERGIGAIANERDLLRRQLVEKVSGPLAGLRAALSRNRRGLIERKPEGFTKAVDPYPAWLVAHRPTRATLAGQRAASHRQDRNPRFSFVVPVFNPPASVLAEMIESVRAQSYGDWELVLADGASTLTGVRDVLDRYCADDHRVRVVSLDVNLGISGNSNAALSAATGDYAVLLDHDDLIEPDLLYEVGQCLDATPDTDIVYFDQDKVSADGRVHSDPWFKPHTWAPEHLLSGNPLMHAVVRTRLLRDVGGFDPATDGAQDWDLMLRLTECPARVAHIPRVLYHWRQLPGSVAMNLGAKPWVIDLQPSVVAAHLRRQGLGEVQYELLAPGLFRFAWPVSGRRVSIIIPSRDKSALLARCLESLVQRTQYPDFEIIVVDTGSVEPATRGVYAIWRDKVSIVTDDIQPFNYSRACNIGARAATGNLLLFLNNDTEVLEPGWLEEMTRWAERPGAGAVGAKLLYPNGTIQHAGVIVGMGHLFSGAREMYAGSYFGSVNWYRPLSAVTGACMLVPRAAFEQVGGFDEGFAIAFGDVDLCLRLRAAGFSVMYTPYARLRHHEGATRANAITPADQRLADQRLGLMVATGDPFFNSNLDPLSRIPALRQTRKSA
ncbi:MAG: glycosyltransferase family 2 protein [Anaerolineae bacterium]|nr:glycosyltransferase family 2 protein [Anaerolineae bacterium]